MIFWCRISLLEQKADLLGDDLGSEISILTNSLGNLRNQLLNFNGASSGGAGGRLGQDEMSVALGGVENRLNSLLDRVQARKQMQHTTGNGNEGHNGSATHNNQHQDIEIISRYTNRTIFMD